MNIGALQSQFLLNSIVNNYLLRLDFLNRERGFELLSDDAKRNLFEHNRPLVNAIQMLENAIIGLLSRAQRALSEKRIGVSLSLRVGYEDVEASHTFNDYVSESISIIYNLIGGLSKVCDEYLYCISLYEAYKHLEQDFRTGRVIIRDSNIGNEISLLHAFIKPELVSFHNFRIESTDHLCFLTSFCEAIDPNTFRELSLKHNPSSLDTTKFVENLSETTPELAKAYKDRYRDWILGILNEIRGLMDSLKPQGADLIVRTLFKNHTLFEIYCFRRLVDAGLVAIPRLTFDSLDSEADVLILIGERDACVVEVTTRSNVDEHKLDNLARCAERLTNNYDFRRVGKLIVCGRDAQINDGIHRIDFVELQDRAKVLSEVYHSISSTSYTSDD